MDSFERSHGNLSMREKSVLKRRINREHNSNFRAGYISINEDYLQKTGIRGRKRYFLYCVVFVLVLVAILNALITAGLVYILKFSFSGLDTLEFVNQNKLARFLVDSSFSSIAIIEGDLGGRSGAPLLFESDGGTISFKALNSEAGLNFDLKDTILEGIDDFSVINSKNGQAIFSTMYPTIQTQSPNRNLEAQLVETSEMKNMEKYEDLYIETYDSLNITGEDGIHIFSGKNIIDFLPGETISVLSKNGSLILDGKNGVFLDTSVHVSQSTQIDTDKNAFKICVCVSPNQDVGKLFMLRVDQAGRNCGDIQPNVDICPNT